MVIKTRVLSPDEIKRILGVDLAPRNKIIIRMLLYTGIRARELVGLICSNVSDGATILPVLHIPANLIPGGRARDIPLCHDIRLDLQSYFSFLYAGNDNQVPLPEHYLVASKYYLNYPLTLRQVQRIIADAGAKAAIPDLHPHIFRRTFTMIASKVMPLPAVQAMLGHRSLQSTQIYCHPSSMDLAAGVNKL